MYGVKCFPLREFCKNQINRNPKIQCLVNTVVESDMTVSQSRCDSFIPVIKEKCGLSPSWWKIMHFQLPNSGYFSLSAAFSWSNWEQYLLELIVWFSGKSSKSRAPFQSHYLYSITFSGWSLVFGVVGGGSFHLPHNLFCSTLLFSTFHCSSQFVLKMECFLC